MAKALRLNAADYHRLEDEDEAVIDPVLAMAVTYMVEHPCARPESEWRTMSTTEMFDSTFCSPRIRDGQEWGPWRLDVETMTLDYNSRMVVVDRRDGEEIRERREDYYITLRDLAKATGILDWLGQIAGKGWGPADLGYLVEALDEIFDLQSRYAHGEGFSDAEAVVRHVQRMTKAMIPATDG